MKRYSRTFTGQPHRKRISCSALLFFVNLKERCLDPFTVRGRLNRLLQPVPITALHYKAENNYLETNI